MRLVVTTRDDHASGIGKLARVKVDPGVSDAYFQLRRPFLAEASVELRSKTRNGGHYGRKFAPRLALSPIVWVGLGGMKTVGNAGISSEP